MKNYSFNVSSIRLFTLTSALVCASSLPACVADQEGPRQSEEVGEASDKVVSTVPHTSPWAPYAVNPCPLVAGGVYPSGTYGDRFDCHGAYLPLTTVQLGGYTTRFDGAVLDGTNMLAGGGLALCTGFDFAGASMVGTSVQCSFTGVDFSYADLTGARVQIAALMGKFTGTNFTSANLVGSVVGGNMDGANFTGATLTNVGFDGSHGTEPASLIGANFSGAVLVGARLVTSNLTNANFTGADLTNATIDTATLAGANFTNANLTGVQTYNSASGAILSNTICPDGTNSDANGGTCAGHGMQ